MGWTTLHSAALEKGKNFELSMEELSVCMYHTPSGSKETQVLNTEEVADTECFARLFPCAWMTVRCWTFGLCVLWKVPEKWDRNVISMREYKTNSQSSEHKQYRQVCCLAKTGSLNVSNNHRGSNVLTSNYSQGTGESMCKISQINARKITVIIDIDSQLDLESRITKKTNRWPCV